MKTVLFCRMQNRLGALDRLLGAFSFRGFMPEQFLSQCQEDGELMEVMISFECPEPKRLEKLMKMLLKQIYVIEVKELALDAKAVTALQRPNVMPMFTDLQPLRRTAHVYNS